MRQRPAADQAPRRTSPVSRRSALAPQVLAALVLVVAGALLPDASAETVALAASTPAVPAGAQPVVVPLTANGTPREPLRVLVHDADVWMAVEDLQAIGMLAAHVPLSRVRALAGAAWLNLSECTDLLDYRFDLGELTLQVDLQPQVMAVNSVAIGARSAGERKGRATSAYLNYSFTGGTGVSPGVFLEGVTSFRGHTFTGYLTHDGAGRTYRGPLTVMLNQEQSLRQVLLGDSLWSGTGLLGAVPIGGVTWQTYFAFEPGFVATPTLDMRGVATTPSTVDILVNGSLVGRQQIPAGPFQLGNIIAQAGSNNVTAIVRDAFGRETQVGSSGYYGSPLLLQPGLSTFAVSAGRIRQERIGAGPAYGDFAAMGQGLLGITHNLTAGAGVQVSADTRVVSGQLTTTNAAGEFSGELAHGRDGDDGGLALALSYRLGTTNWSVSANMMRRQRGFRELAWFSGLDQVLRADDLSLGRNWLGIDWSLRFGARSTASGDRLRRLSLSATQRWTSQLTTSIELARSSGSLADTSVFLLASYMLDPVHSAYVGVARYGGEASMTLDVVRARQEALSTGWRLATGWTPQGGDRQSLQVVRDTAFGDYELQAGRGGSGNYHTWRASGSLLTVGGEVGAAPPIGDAFALVRVPDGPDVPVMLEGRLAGRTGADGTLVVPGLSSYSGQRISIDADALPIDFQVGAVERRISAPLRGGELVEFEASRYRASSGRLLDAQGHPIAGATIALADGRRVATGTSGDFAVEGEPPRGTARVARPGGGASCTVQFPAAAASAAAVQRLGELRCVP